MIQLYSTLLLAAGIVEASVRLGLRREPLEKLVRRSLESGEVSLENKVSYYQTVLLVGTPPQELMVQIDTGSSDLWVLSTENPYCQRPGVHCVPNALYDHRISSTFRSNSTDSDFSITYGDSTFAQGKYIQDDIQIGGIEFIHSQRDGMGASPNGVYNPADTRGQWVSETSNSLASKVDEIEETRDEEPLTKILIKDANFALATRANSTEAVWGIGLEASESMARSITSDGTIFPTYPNLPVQMKQQGYIKTVAYSLWLNDLASASGTLLFGAVDHSKYRGQLQTVPLVGGKRGVEEPVDFSVALHGIGAYNDQGDTADIVRCSLLVLLDSGTTFTQLPQTLIQPVADTLGAQFLEQHGVYVVNSTQRQLINSGGLKFNFSGVEIDVAIDDLLVPIGGLDKLPAGTIFGDQKIATRDESFAFESISTELKLFPRDSDRANQKYRQLPSDMYYLLGLLPIEYSIGGGYIMGDTFMRSVYAVFDLENKEIGLANTHFNATGSQIDEMDGQNGIPRAVPAKYYTATKQQNKIVALGIPPLFQSTTVGAAVSLQEEDPTTLSLAIPSTATLHTTSLSGMTVSSTSDLNLAISSHKSRPNAGNRPVWGLGILVCAIGLCVLA